jgi:hypothetical protein
VQIQITAYFDLLGFASIIKSSDAESQERVLSLLTSLSEATGEFSHETAKLEGGRHEISVRPAISAFSDNIVFSFPLTEMSDLGAGPIVFYLANDAARILMRGLEIGCLLRGAISVGPLHHSSRVVFGHALVEAYELESKFTRTPRIIVSELANEALSPNPYLFRDEDGFVCLDVVRAAYDQVPSGAPGAAGQWDAKRAWIKSVRRKCERQIAVLKEAGNLAGLQNWQWFLTRFNRFVDALPAGIVES